jgi:hypothetical protein
MKLAILFIALNSVSVFSLGLYSQKEAEKKTYNQLVSKIVKSYQQPAQCSKLYCSLPR